MRDNKSPVYSKKYSSLIGWPDFRNKSASWLFLFACDELGGSLFYMKFLNPPESMWGAQVKRVQDLCRKLATEGKAKRFPNSTKNRMWFRKLLSDIADEIENQC